MKMAYPVFSWWNLHSGLDTSLVNLWSTYCVSVGPVTYKGYPTQKLSLIAVTARKLRS